MKAARATAVAAQLRDLIQRDTGQSLPSATLDNIVGLLRNAYAHTPGGDEPSAFTDQQVTILLADLRGFTAVAATHEAGTVIQVLNRCLSRLSEIVFRHQGMIDKFMGDSVMVLFGAPVMRMDDVQRALHCAVDMQRAMQELNREHREMGLPELFLGIGINTGRVLAGTLGTDAYSEYTVIGDEVNLVSRIEAFTLRGQILISDTTWRACGDYIRCGEPMSVLVKGKSHSVQLREVLAIPSLGLEVPRLEVRRSHRIEVDLPLAYQVLQHKIVLPQTFIGQARDIGYHGLLIELAEPLPVHTEIRLAFNLPLVGFAVTDLYAKIVSVKERDGAMLAGVEFTSLSAEVNMNIQMFTQLLIMQR